MNTSLLYREATLEEVDALADLAKAAFGQYRTQLSDEGWSELSTNLENKGRLVVLQAKSEVFVCCDEGGEIVGMAFLVPSGNADDIYEAGWCHLRMVSVAPQQSGKGIGRRLTEMCVERARHNGEKTMALHTSEMMDAARHIYESMGFAVVREIPPRFGKKYWLYTLPL